MNELKKVEGKVTMYGSAPVSIAPNGYHYIKWEGERRLLHHVIAEEMLGRKLEKDERVYFIDKDRANFDPKNIEARKKAKSKDNRVRYLKDRINMDVEELLELVPLGEVSAYLRSLTS